MALTISYVVLCGTLPNLFAALPNFLFLFYLEMDAAGALLLHTSGTISSAVVLLEATDVMVAVYGGDHKLSGESAPSSSPSSLFSAPIACSVGLEH